MVEEESQAGLDEPRSTPDATLAGELRLSPGYLLARLGADARGMWARMLSERGLTPHHFGVLMAVEQLGETHQQRLARAIGVDPRNAVGILDGLSERALLEYARDPDDRRRKLIRLTSNGTKAVAELRAAGAAIENDLFAGLTRQERRTLHLLLLKIFNARGHT